MKTTIKTVLGFVLSAFSLIAVAQCPTITNMNVTLGANGTATIAPVLSSPTSTLTHYYWAVTPSATQTNGGFQMNGVFQFPSNGSYTVTVYVNDSISSCAIHSNAILNVNNMPASSCNASFTSFTDSACATHFINTSTGTNLTYNWSINDSTFTTVSPTTNLPNGSYAVTLLSYSGGTLCDSAYQIVNIACPSTTTTPSCQVSAGFSMYADSLISGNYYAYNTSSGNDSLSYLWNFGDGTTSTQPYPSHQYSTPGQYIICLTVTNVIGALTCSSTFCDSSSVNKSPSSFIMSNFSVIQQGTTGIKSADLLKSLKAYPNPMADELTVEINTIDNTEFHFLLMDGLGRTIINGTLDNSKAVINTSTLEHGFYNLTITNEVGAAVKTMKLVK